MEVTVQIPDDLAPRLMAGGHDLSREALELIAAEAYRQAAEKMHGEFAYFYGAKPSTEPADIKEKP